MSEIVSYFEGAAKTGQDEAVRAQSVSDDFDCRMSQFARCVEVLREECDRVDLWRTRALRYVAAVRAWADAGDESEADAASEALCDLDEEAKRDGWEREK